MPTARSQDDLETVLEWAPDGAAEACAQHHLKLQLKGQGVTPCTCLVGIGVTNRSQLTLQLGLASST
eukprot:scaffold244610_cov13-Tisochrysis_lutea.AAC.1